MKKLGIPKYFLAIEIVRSHKGIYLSQHKYTLDIISEMGLLGSKPIDTSMEQKHGPKVDHGKPIYDTTQ